MSDTDPDLTVLGALDENELREVKGLQQMQASLLLQHGELGDRQLDLLIRLREAKARSEALIRGAVSRIGIPDGTPYQLGGDGVFRRTELAGG